MDPWDVALFPRLVPLGVSTTILGHRGEENPVPVIEVVTLRRFNPWRRIGVLRELGSKIHGFAWDERLRLPPSPFTFDDAIVGLAEHAKTFDVLLALETYRASTYQACKRHPGVVVKVTENIPGNPPQLPYPWMKAAVRRRSARFACVTESAREAMLQEGFPRDRIVVIPEAIDTDLFRPREGGPPEEGPLRIGFAGRLDDLHGFLVLLHAFADLAQEADAVLKVAGDGPLVPQMQAVAARPDLAGRVEYVGKLPHRKMPDFLAGIDVLCVPCAAVPGWKPQFGVVNAEAMACGKPLVGTRVGATPEIVPPGFQPFLVPPGDSGTLKTALRTLALDRSLRARLGSEGRDWVLRRFALDRISERWKSLLVEVCEERGRGGAGTR